MLIFFCNIQRFDCLFYFCVYLKKGHTQGPKRHVSRFMIICDKRIFVVISIHVGSIPRRALNETVELFRQELISERIEARYREERLKRRIAELKG